VLVLLLLGSARCYSRTDWENVKIPFLSGATADVAPASGRSGGRLAPWSSASRRPWRTAVAAATGT